MFNDDTNVDAAPKTSRRPQANPRLVWVTPLDLRDVWVKTCNWEVKTSRSEISHHRLISLSVACFLAMVQEMKIRTWWKGVEGPIKHVCFQKTIPGHGKIMCFFSPSKQSIEQPRNLQERNGL